MGTKLVLGSLVSTSLCIGLVYLDCFGRVNPKLEEKEVLSDGVSRYCESWRISVELNNIRGFDVVPQECIDYIGYYMTSMQYEVDRERVVEEMKLYVRMSCKLVGDGKDGWIFDVDDTLLSTIPYFKEHHVGGERLNRSSLEEWMKEKRAPSLKQSLHIFNELRDDGFKIFLISSRSESLRLYTVGNLINVGYHGWSLLVLRAAEDELISVQEYKARVRKKLMDEGYRIWGIVGDQWSSIIGLPFAKRTFKLPNSMYYVS